MNSLKGKVALVTGVASKSSIGHAVALKLAGEGANIVVLDKYAVPQNLIAEETGWGGLNDVVAEIKSQGSEALAVTANIASSEEVNAAIAKALETFKKIDILVHCAGIRGPVSTPMIDIAEEEWKSVVDINLNGTFIISQAISRNMVERGDGGKIVIIASMGGVKGMSGSSPYCASKFGTIGLVKSLALELAQYNINVNAVNPGAVTTNLRDNYYKEVAEAEGITIEEARDRHNEKSVGAIPLARFGTPEDIARLVLYLVTDESSYITGEAINISGGIS